MEWMLMPLRRYADFQGRSRRKEYWMYTLLVVIAYLIIALIGGALAAMMGSYGQDNSSAAVMGAMMPMLVLVGLLWLGLIVPTIAVTVRRFHDQDKSGWFALLLLAGMIPYIGIIASIALLVFMCLEGTKGPNRFGPDPKEAQSLGDVFS